MLHCWSQSWTILIDETQPSLLVLSSYALKSDKKYSLTLRLLENWLCTLETV